MEDRSRISRCFCLFYFFLTLIAADTIESSHMKWIKLCKKLKASAWRIASWLKISEFLVLFVLFLFTLIAAGKIDSSHMKRIELYKKLKVAAWKIDRLRISRCFLSVLFLFNTHRDRYDRFKPYETNYVMQKTQGCYVENRYMTQHFRISRCFLFYFFLTLMSTDT